MFHTINMATWPRAQVYYYFAKMAPTAYSITVEVDVTGLMEKLHAAEIKFFPAYLWLVTRNLNRQIEFKCAIAEGKLGCYDTLTPLYAAWHDDDKTFSLMWTAYDDDFEAFYQNYLKNHAAFGQNHGILAQPMTPPPANAYTVSEIPWIPFRHFAVHNFDNKDYYFPSVEAGCIIERDGHSYLPLSLTCHHATTDGYHITRFLEDLQSDIERFIKWLEGRKEHEQIRTTMEMDQG